MSKLSIHISGSPTGLGNLLTKCFDAGSPVGVLYSLNQNLNDDIARYSPPTKWVYRRQTEEFNRLPNGFFTGDPVKSAQDWLVNTKDAADKNRSQIENILLNNPTWADVLNEPAIEIADPNDPVQVAEAVRRAKWLNTWMVTALEIAHSYGVKLAMFSFPTQSPPSDARIWNELLPSLRLGKQYGAILSLHCYGDPRGDNPPGYLASLPEAYLQHKSIYAIIPDDAKLPVIYSEAGAGNGYNTGVKGQAYVDDLARCDSAWSKEPYVIAGCSFQLGVSTESNMAEIMGAYGDYIASAPFTPPSPPLESPDNTEVPPTDKIVDWAGHVWRLGATAVHGSVILRDDNQFGGGQGVMLLYYSKKVYTKNDMNEWYYATDTAWVKTLYPRAQHRLNVPWVGQNTTRTDDDYSNSDCGPADVCMWLRYRGVSVSVDDVSKATGLYPKFTYTNFYDLDKAANKYGLNLKYKLGSMTQTVIKSEIDANRPCIVLVKYPYLTTRYASTYTGCHWILVTGYDEANFYYNDPYWLDESGKSVSITHAKMLVAMDKVVLNGNTPHQGIIEEIEIVSPPVTVIKFGLGAGTQDVIPQSHVDVYGTAFGSDSNSAFKFLTLPDAENMTVSVQRIKAKTPNAFLMARMFLSTGDTPVSPQDFVDYSYVGTAVCYQNGIRHYEVGNESNLPDEGMGLSWTNGYTYGVWLKEVLNTLRGRYPDAKFWFPGLSPNDAAPQFLAETLTTPGLTGMLYGYCFHSYFTSATGGAYPMDTEAGGLSFKKLRRVLPASEQAKPFSISEFSYNTPSVSYIDKGRTYKSYRALLQREGAHSAFSFVLNWNSDVNRENWCVTNDGSTGIAAGYLA